MNRTICNTLQELDDAEKDLRFYTAIIGHRPTVDPTAPALEDALLEDCDDNMEEVRRTLKLHPMHETQLSPQNEAIHLGTAAAHGRLSVWIRKLSVHARKRFDEACHRLAS